MRSWGRYVKNKMLTLIVYLCWFTSQNIQIDQDNNRMIDFKNSRRYFNLDLTDIHWILITLKLNWNWSVYSLKHLFLILTCCGGHLNLGMWSNNDAIANGRALGPSSCLKTPSILILTLCNYYLMALEEVGGTIVDTRKYMYKVTRDFTTIFTNIFLSGNWSVDSWRGSLWIIGQRAK